MVPLLLGIGAAMIIGAGVQSKFTPDDRPQKQVDLSSRISTASNMTSVAALVRW
jgi:hypothetical protein